MSAVADNTVYHRIVWHPDINNERLAYCNTDGNLCGKPVADEFCRIMGYEHSDKHIIAHNVGLTHFIDTSMRCQGWECDGFKNIRCKGEIKHTPPEKWHYSLRKFVYPRFGNYRVDWCYDGTKDCGRRAAFSFCRQMGFYKVKSFKRQHRLAATKAIGNQKLCFQEGCTGFSYISCQR